MNFFDICNGEMYKFRNAMRDWGKDYVRVLCTKHRCAHEWDVHKSEAVKTELGLHPRMYCTWCGWPGKTI